MVCTLDISAVKMFIQGIAINTTSFFVFISCVYSWPCSSVGEHGLSGTDNEIICWRYPASTSNSCNTGMSALPDIYAQRPRANVDIRIRQCMSASIATNMLNFRHSKNLPKLIANRSAYFYSKG